MTVWRDGQGIHGQISGGINGYMVSGLLPSHFTSGETEARESMWYILVELEKVSVTSSTLSVTSWHTHNHWLSNAFASKTPTLSWVFRRVSQGIPFTTE